MNSHIDKFNPMEYERGVDLVPQMWVDHFNQTPRKIRCISDGTEEMEFLIHLDEEHERSDGLRPDLPIWQCDLDDFSYYLRGIIGKKLLVVGEHGSVLGDNTGGIGR